MPQPLDSDALVHFLSEVRPDLLDRFESNMLSDDELRDSIRNHIMPTGDRFRRLRPRDIAHAPGCEWNVEFDVDRAESATSEEWEMTKIIRRGAEERCAELQLQDPEVVLLEHVGVCSNCGRMRKRKSIGVTVYWGGAKFTRQYGV